MSMLDDGVRTILSRLIGFDTVSAKSNLALIEWIADYLDGHGIRSSLTRDESRTKANLFATIGPEDVGGIVLSGHTDVVPVTGQAWTTDPFALSERDGRLYGRGTADMKGFIALALAKVPRFKERIERQARPKPIHLALSYDEEVGCLGVPRLIEALPEGAARPKLAIIGEPTGMALVNAHKGCWVFQTVVTGLDGHSSAPDKAVNAILAASEIIQVIAGIAGRHRRNADPAGRFDPPYTTFNIGVIEGGTANNIVPRECRFTWEFRMLPETDGASILREIEDFVTGDLLPRMRRVHPGSSVVTRSLVRLPGLVPEPEGAAEALVRHLMAVDAASAIAFGTEGGLFQAAGLSAIVCGPGSIDQAHRPDEFISLEQLAAGSNFLDRLAGWL